MYQPLVLLALKANAGMHAICANALLLLLLLLLPLLLLLLQVVLVVRWLSSSAG
jgi:hypothetical protein